jgi:hypothetical protein
MRKASVVILAILLLSSCGLKEKLGTPKAEDFTEWFNWFVDFFKPNDLSSNQEVFIYTLLILIVAGSVAALINSTRALNFFKEPPFNNSFLSLLLLSPTLLMFPLRSIKHPGWALGIWVFLRCFYICFLLFFTFVIFFYLAVILHIIIIIAIVIVILLIFSAGN